MRCSMNAKKFIYALATFVLLSCSDDILDKKPLDRVGETDVFEDENLLRNFVNGTYRGLKHSFDDENSFSDGLTDNAYNQHGSANGTIKVYTSGEISADNAEPVTRQLWRDAYINIRRVNLFFEKTTDSPIDSDALTVMSGEMQFLRAFLYFDLLRWYGGVPIITNTFNLDAETFEVARNSADEVAQFIVSECDDAIAKLPSITSIASGRANKEAAMALKARTLLYIASPLFNESNSQDKWTAARDANKAVMDLATVSLVSSAEEYGNLFSGDNSKEIILARQFTQTNNQGWGVNLWLYSNGYGGWNTTTPTQNLVDDYELTNGLLPSDPGSGYDDQNPYVDRDPRFYESILYNGAQFREQTYDFYVDVNDVTQSGKDSPQGVSKHNVSRTGYSFRKYTEEDKPAEGSGENTLTNPWIIFRLAEFYLNYAEAEIALGNEGDARTAINAVRTRIGMPEVTADTGPELVERYRRERRIELVLEDHRFFDMRRWKIGAEVLDKQVTKVDVFRNGATMEYIYGELPTTLDNRNWDDKLYFLPVPAEEIRRSNGKLTQNPGYTQ
jgi:starch-binding outer membrane protein, SusD/RagB family